MRRKIEMPHLEPVPGTNNYRLLDDWWVWLPVSKKWLLIKAGFVFDGASIPWFLWSVVGNPWDPNWVAEALAHDGLYAAELVEKHRADKELFHLMKQGTKKARDNARYFFIAVDDFGDAVWAKHTARSIAEARTYCSLSDAGPVPPIPEQEQPQLV